ncbi:non-hydrolyzing UDP-N-acetylglucosamine 2-epimerase [Methanocella sp. MCL-LM]|uniref:non-hydrolyzing UDP-N-acetylglucosamine 2-epimerase n=1 Tax=Methanocella sp. MCL-LM TaxID=3412035 RepID=UPI003C77279F
MKVLTVVGARPNFIKMAPVSKELKKTMDEVIVHTGQHYDYELDKIFFDELHIPAPDYHLGVGSGSHGFQTGEMLKKIDGIIAHEKPDIVLVYGDTNSTFAGALGAAKMHVPVAHIEAGLRSFDRRMPEEINRVLTDHISNLLFCPTEAAVKHLAAEGVTEGVHLTGDVSVDAMKAVAEIAEKRTEVLASNGLRQKSYSLATVHRAENTDSYVNLSNIVDAFSEIGDVVLPVHPRTEKYLKKFNLWDQLADHVKIIRPVGYLDMIALEKNARMILTDSGGVQKEAYILSVPCVTLRENTEWVETVSDGWNVLVGSDKARIVGTYRDFRPASSPRNVFGDGNARARIREIIEEYSA